jgi:hypothetical protein
MSWPVIVWVALAVGRSRRLVRQASVAGLCGLLLLGGYFAYNAATTGHWSVSGYTLYDPDERPGFGVVGQRAHTPERGLRHVRQNLQRLNYWWLGFNGSLLALLGLTITRWRPQDLILLAAAASLVAGYFFFYYSGVSTVGPVYYFETILALSLLGGRSLVALWQVGAARAGISRLWPLGAVGGAAWLVSLGLFYQDRIPSWTSMFGSQRRLHAAMTATQPGRSLILLDLPETSWYGVRYDPREPLGPIFLRSDAERDQRLLAKYPDRAVYRYRRSRLERIQ